jgi:hypothetical protein
LSWVTSRVFSAAAEADADGDVLADADADAEAAFDGWTEAADGETVAAADGETVAAADGDAVAPPVDEQAAAMIAAIAMSTMSVKRRDIGSSYLGTG